MGGGKGKIAEYAVCVRQGCRVFAAVPCKLYRLRPARRFRHEAWDFGMALYAGFHAAVIAQNPAAQRMVLSDLIQNGVIAAGGHMIEIRIPFSDHRFPYEKLGSGSVGELICAVVLAAP